MTDTPSSLKRTPLHAVHVSAGAKMVPFGGWDMPVQYTGIIEEHRCVRSAVGLFDISHMGEFEVRGVGALAAVQGLTTNDASTLAVDQVQYSVLCYPNGGIVDDLTLYRLADDHYMLTVNASNIDKDWAWVTDGGRGATWTNVSEATALLAVQGPKAEGLVQRLADRDVTEVLYYHFAKGSVAGIPCLISRTGYTGEDGVEVILPAKFAGEVVKLILSKVGQGEDAPIRPAGLGARDSLRLEAAMALYGHEITEDFDPLSAGLNFAIKLDKGDDNPEIGRFIGQDALQKIARDGLKRKLVGLKLEGKRSARQDMAVTKGGKQVGAVTSGCLSPTLGYPIAMAYVDIAQSETGNALQVDLGKATVEAQVVAMPFYKSK